MISTVEALRRGMYAVFAASAAGGAAVAALAVPSATAATDPCAASELAKTIGSVATSMGTYLDAHPQTNQAGRTAAGRGVAREFAGCAADRADDGCSRRGATRHAVARFGRHAGHRPAARPVGCHRPLVGGDADRVAIDAPELRIQDSSRLVNRKARKSAPFLLSF